MDRLFIEAQNLVCSDGNVWLWKSESMDGVRHFATKEDAQKYIELHHQFSRENGREEVAYSMGTEDDFLAAAKEFERKKKANEVKEYCKHVDALIERRQLEIKALDGLIQVCRKFDGKVLNKRFHDAVYDVTGFYNSFSQYSFELECYGCDCRGYRPYVIVSADWSHGKGASYPTLQWQWNTGERLEAEKAVAVIEQYKNDYLAAIEKLKASKRKYAAYLKLARKAEQIFKDMKQYDYEIQEFARTHALSKYHCLSNSWLSY